MSEEENTVPDMHGDQGGLGSVSGTETIEYRRYDEENLEDSGLEEMSTIGEDEAATHFYTESDDPFDDEDMDENSEGGEESSGEFTEVRAIPRITEGGITYDAGVEGSDIGSEIDEEMEEEVIFTGAQHESGRSIFDKKDAEVKSEETSKREVSFPYSSDTDAEIIRTPGKPSINIEPNSDTVLPNSQRRWRNQGSASLTDSGEFYMDRADTFACIYQHFERKIIYEQKAALKPSVFQNLEKHLGKMHNELIEVAKIQVDYNYGNIKSSQSEIASKLTNLIRNTKENRRNFALALILDGSILGDQGLLNSSIYTVTSYVGVVDKQVMIPYKTLVLKSEGTAIKYSEGNGWASNLYKIIFNIVPKDEVKQMFYHVNYETCRKADVALGYPYYKATKNGNMPKEISKEIFS